MRKACFVIIVALCILNSGCNLNTTEPDSTITQDTLYTVPILGWNTFDCYGTLSITESLMIQNLFEFNRKLKPLGYQYFIIDNGWGNEDLDAVIDEYGRNIADPVRFPNGMKAFADLAHSMDIKVGLWIVRGISRKAVRQNLPIYRTAYFARDIADTTNTCIWCNHNFGIDMSKSGAQEYYNSKIELYAEWGIDFIKFDDSMKYPAEILAIRRAINTCGRDIVLSLSPGNDIDPLNNNWAYKMSDMIRITNDMWDDRDHIIQSFDRWELMIPWANGGYALDLDMIPFGYFERFNRMDSLTISQKLTFITQRALAASPLIFGGSLLLSDPITFQIITNVNMLKCNQNGMCGSLILRQGSIDVWSTYDRLNRNNGWVGIFNRTQSATAVSLTKRQIGLIDNANYSFYDIWGNITVSDSSLIQFHIEPDGVAFLRYDIIQKERLRMD